MCGDRGVFSFWLDRYTSGSCHNTNDWFTSILLIYIFAKKTNNKLMFGLLTMGYAARVGIMFIDIYGSSLFTILHSGDDTERFYIRSVEYYEGNYSHFTTYYPYIIKDIYEIFGKNRLIAQYVNILCWVGVVFVVLAACKLFHVKEKCVIFIMHTLRCFQIIFVLAVFC